MSSPAAADDWNPEQYAREARFVADYGRDLISWLAPQTHERVLDLGCGDGALTADLAAVCQVVGVDASPRQIAAAQDRGLQATVMCGEELCYDAEFDAVFSNAALHWMLRPDAVLAGVYRALKPGGRFVAEFGAQGNTALVSRALAAALERRGRSFEQLSPWYFPSADEYQARLEQAGFQVSKLIVFPRPTPLPGELTGWLETFGSAFCVGETPAEKRALYEEVAAATATTLRDADGRWMVDYVRLRFRAEKPAAV